MSMNLVVYESHLCSMGRMIEGMESKLKNSLDQVYFGKTREMVYHRAAQIRMIEEALRFAGLSDELGKIPRSVVDVGCGIGGSFRYLANKYGAKCQGIALRSFQAKRAQALAAQQGLDDRVCASFPPYVISTLLVFLLLSDRVDSD